MTWKIATSADGRLTVAFAGALDAASGLASALAFAQALGDESRNVVFDIREMKGYESGARIAWQQTIGPKRKQLLSLVVVGGRPLVKVGALTLALFLRIPHRFVADPKEI